uniref:Uncharacterized protein n=1 Tax=Solanum tuberosum TaxID=4113 RepID=M1A9D4_SOLTU
MAGDVKLERIIQSGRFCDRIERVGFGITAGANSRPLKKQHWQIFPRAWGQSAVAQSV